MPSGLRWSIVVAGCAVIPAAACGATETRIGTGICEPGATTTASDGCNTCTCNEPGQWECTQIACPLADGGVPICSLPFRESACLAYIPVYAYVDGACVPRIYGGCGGRNENRFRSIEECMAICESRPIPGSCPADRVMQEICIKFECAAGGTCVDKRLVCAKPCQVDADCPQDLGPDDAGPPLQLLVCVGGFCQATGCG